MTRYQLMQALFHAAELVTDQTATGVEVGEHVALVGFHDEGRTVWTVTVSKVGLPETAGETIRRIGAKPTGANEGRLN